MDPCIPRNWDPSRENGCRRGVTSAGACPGRYIGGVTPQSLPINGVRWVDPCIPRNWDPSRENGCGSGVTSAGACPGRYIGGVTPQSLPINRHVPGKLLGSGRISYMLLNCGRTNVWKPWDRFSEQQQSHEQIIPIQSSENRAGREGGQVGGWIRVFLETGTRAGKLDVGGGSRCWGLSWTVHWRGHPPVTSNKRGSVGGSVYS